MANLHTGTVYNSGSSLSAAALMNLINPPDPVDPVDPVDPDDPDDELILYPCGNAWKRKMLLIDFKTVMMFRNAGSSAGMFYPHVESFSNNINDLTYRNEFIKDMKFITTRVLTDSDFNTIFEAIDEGVNAPNRTIKLNEIFGKEINMEAVNRIFALDNKTGVTSIPNHEYFAKCEQLLNKRGEFTPRIKNDFSYFNSLFKMIDRETIVNHLTNLYGFYGINDSRTDSPALKEFNEFYKGCISAFLRVKLSYEYDCHVYLKYYILESILRMETKDILEIYFGEYE
jgi:hypothetical protein